MSNWLEAAKRHAYKYKYLLVSFAFAIVAVIAICYSHKAKPTGHFLLTGAPEFIIESLIVALSLYLREVEVEVLDSQYKIHHNLLWNEPPENNHKKEKLVNLQRTLDAIFLATPFLFLLILTLCYRIVLDGLQRFGYRGSHFYTNLYDLDLIIIFWFALALIGLTVAHTVVRRHDARLEKTLRKERSRIELQEGTTTSC